MGTEMTIPDTAIANLDFINSGNNRFDGWTPSFSQVGPSLDAEVSATGGIVPSMAIGLEISIDTIVTGKQAASAGIALLAPELALNFQAIASTNTGFCGNPDAIAAVNFGVDLKGSLIGFAGLDDIAAFPNRVDIVTVATNLFSTCLTVTLPPGRAAPTPAPGSPVGNTDATPTDTPVVPPAQGPVKITSFSNKCCGDGSCPLGVVNSISQFDLVSNDGLCHVISPGGAEGGGFESFATGNMPSTNCRFDFFSDNVCSQGVGSGEVTTPTCLMDSLIPGAGQANFAVLTCS
jgi:hypothetical protein